VLTLAEHARRMGAEEAERRGLVSRVVPAAELMDTAQHVARSIASKSRLAVAKAKECLQRAQELSLAEGLLFEQCAPQPLDWLEMFRCQEGYPYRSSNSIAAPVWWPRLHSDAGATRTALCSDHMPPCAEG
jgi:hypothetical protein